MRRALLTILVMGLSGTAFSGVLSYRELCGSAAGCRPVGAPGTILGLPACVYGFFFFLAITVVAATGLRRAGVTPPAAPPT